MTSLPTPAEVEPTGRVFMGNVVAFGRALRRAGIGVVPEQVADLARALELVGVDDRESVRRAARALLVTRRSDLEVFDFVFNAFWSHPDRSRGPRLRTPTRSRPRPTARGRFTIAAWSAERDRPDTPEVEVGDRTGTWSSEEALQSKAFSRMTPEELDQVRRMIDQMRWSLPVRVTRRRVSDRRGGSVDLRRTLRDAARLGAVPAPLPRRRRSRRHRPVVLIADVSGSMERYSRLVLHLFHAILRSFPDTEAFLFGTRLTRITPELRVRNPDRAIEDAARQVVDWAGGTRIGASLGEFNTTWGRRVLGRGAVVVILSDGCDRGDPELLKREMRHLALRCHRLVWLNPHLGHPEYSPRVAGMEAALPHIDDFLSVRDLRSLGDFVTALARIPRTRGARGTTWREA